MRILYVAHRIPYPPDKGDKIRSFNQVRYLGRRHELWCACFVDDANDLEHVNDLRPWCAELQAVPINRNKAVIRSLWALAAGGTATEGFYRDGRMAALLGDWSRRAQFDAAVFFSSGVAQYRPCVTAGRMVLDFCDWDSLKWSDYARRSRSPLGRLLQREAGRLRRREADWIGQFDASVVITDYERADAPTSADDQRIHVVGNGVHAGPEPVTPPGAAANNVGFVGQMDYPPNVDAVCWFVRQVWPAVRRDVPQARFNIIGRSPLRSVRALAQIPGVRVTGAVKDVRAEIERLAVSVAPMHMGRGLQNKVLEAMAAARPVVLSPTAARGIDATAPQHFLVAHGADEFARHVVALLHVPARRDEIGLAARRRVMERYRWDIEMAKLESLLMGAACPAPTQRAASIEAALASV